MKSNSLLDVYNICRVGAPIFHLASRKSWIKKPSRYCVD